jgi:ABC-type microcin C transport system permease subunit YejE
MLANLKERDYFKAWALFYSFSLACGALMGTVVGTFAGAYGDALQLDRSMVVYSTQIAVFVLSLPISYLLFRFFVNRVITRKLLVPLDDAGAA